MISKKLSGISITVKQTNVWYKRGRQKKIKSLMNAMQQ